MIAEIIIENLVNIIATLLIALIGVLGTWLTAKISKKTELTNIGLAQGEVFNMAQLTVGELQQTVVEKLKASHEDGKLTEDEIKDLGNVLVQKTMEKMSEPTYNLLKAAGVDITSLIKGAGESWINTIGKH